MTAPARDQLQESLAYHFSDFTHLNLALTHPSFHNEQEHGGGDYQRLEFLGDAILGMLLAEMLYSRFPAADEGELSRTRAQLAEQSTLAGIARERGIGAYIRVGRGEEQSAGRDKDSILCDVLEALIAAVYLDGGLEAARRVVAALFDELLDAPQGLMASRDAKSELQELLSARGLSAPEYQLVDESGPPHDRQFHFLVLIEGRVAGQGQGRSKKIAQQAAATRALERLLSDGGSAA
ncbi:MAG: ribonuclease III [Verrucomicrobia bacterium]|nr:ribonuclease III [Deltaproteobacteria bacterium]